VGGARGEVIRATTEERLNRIGLASSRSTAVTIASEGPALTTAIPVVAQTAQICVALVSFARSLGQKWHNPVRSRTTTRNTIPTRLMLQLICLLRRSLSKFGWLVKHSHRAGHRLIMLGYNRRRPAGNGAFAEWLCHRPVADSLSF
jgi:hypothetical protein